LQIFRIVMNVFFKHITFQALNNRLKYSLDEDDKENGVNAEALDNDKIDSASTPPTSVDE
jgi:hypothetical protein